MVEKGYPYIMMLDNDAHMDMDTLKGLQKYLKYNPDVGIVGTKIMILNNYERIMDRYGFLYLYRQIKVVRSA